MERLLQFTGITAENIAAITSISGTYSGGTRMEFKKIRIMNLIPASYNSRKKLKSGDKE